MHAQKLYLRGYSIVDCDLESEAEDHAAPELWAALAAISSLRKVSVCNETGFSPVADRLPSDADQVGLQGVSSPLGS